MSFITKRERVFKEYDLFDLPSRNEGKLKAYASCTDARAWSHFCSDKTEHLVDIIKRNNEKCRPKYVPTDVIVDTLMVAKNTEIARLKRKIEEFEQMVAAYDQLELSCEQKCEIANAHAAIKAANKELDDMFLDLDLSGFTEIDSEAFETGKSRGDEPSKYRMDETPKSRDEWTYEKENRPKTDTKSNQTGAGCLCDATTYATDPRIEEMKDTIITKDAKLSAMQNTIAVMENDVCEPYCIYAHIYTALEKIFGILCQNEKYKQYLDLLTTGKDIRSVDVKGKILFKLKVLEKFSLALIAPCSQDHNSAPEDCTCYKTQIVARFETTYALSSQKLPKLDNKRAQLIADIMENDEMKEILSKESANLDEDVLESSNLDEDTCSIDGENLKRLKNLQENYNDLLECYENLKHERNCLQLKCQKYDELEREVEALRNQIREYNALWSEKEYFRKRSVDLDDLKEHYLVLTNETTNLETKLKTEIEINKIKSETIEELRKNNIALEKKLNDTEITFEKERNTLECKLKETECKVMCQEQQIRSLNVQIDKLIEQEDYSNTLNCDKNALSLLNQIESLKEEVLNLKEALCYGEEERQNSLKDFQDKIALINQLKIEIEDWKAVQYSRKILSDKCEKALQRNDELENVTENYEIELQRLTEENKCLLMDVEERTAAVGNLINIISNKSEEINQLMSEIDHKNILNNNLNTQIESQASTIEILESEKNRTMTSLELTKSESRELVERTKDYENLLNQNNKLSRSLSDQIREYNMLKDNYETLTMDNNKLKNELNEIQILQELNNTYTNEIAELKDERDHYKTSFILTKKESEVLDQKLREFEEVRQQFQALKDSDEKNLLTDSEKNDIGNDNDAHNADTVVASIYRREDSVSSKNLLEPEKLKEDILNYRESYQNLKNENLNLKTLLCDVQQEKEMIINQMKSLSLENEKLFHKDTLISELEEELNNIKETYKLLIEEKEIFELCLETKKQEIENYKNQLNNQKIEKEDLCQQLKELSEENTTFTQKINEIEKENKELRRETNTLTDTIQKYDDELNKLTKEFEVMKMEKDNIEKEYESKLMELNSAKRENRELTHTSQTLISLNDDLENALIAERSQGRSSSEFLKKSYEDISREIADLNQQKIETQNKIRDLMDRGDELEIIISNLSEDVMARDDKIVGLENHINELENEIRRLQTCVATAIDAGEQIKQDSFHIIDDALNAMNARRISDSKATHDLKIDYDKLQNENALLEKKLSNTKLRFSDSFNDRNELLSQIDSLRNDSEIVITGIKEIEVKFVGDSELSPVKCDTVHVLNSLERIRNSLERSNTKALNLEQTLLKVQSSSQLLLTKADEGKKIVELEKQKIITEKEEAIKERQDLEEKLLKLKEKLEEQICSDENIIKDLEQQILNKDLIIDKIDKSTKSYITKLEDDINSLQESYENATNELTLLRKQLQTLSDQNKVYCQEINNGKRELEEKTKEVLYLQTALEEVQNQTDQLVLANSKLKEKCKEIDYLQETIQKHNNLICASIGINTSSVNLILEAAVNAKRDKAIQVEDNVNNDIRKSSAKSDLGRLFCEHSKQKLQALKAIQVTNISVEPKFDARNFSIFKSSIDEPNPLETHNEISITSTLNKTYKSDSHLQIKPSDLKNVKDKSINNKEGPSLHLKTSKDKNEEPRNTADYTSTEKYEVNKNYIKDNNETKGKTEKSEKSADMFLVYKDSDTDTHSMNKSKVPTPWPPHYHSEVVETLLIHPQIQKLPNRVSKNDEAHTSVSNNHNKQGINITLTHDETKNTLDSKSIKKHDMNISNFEINNEAKSVILKSEESTDRFIVYKDSDTDNQSVDKSKQSTSLPLHYQSEVVETLMIHPKMQTLTNRDYRNNEASSTSKDKHGVKITLPRVELIQSPQTSSPKTGTSSFDSFNEPITYQSVHSENDKMHDKKGEIPNKKEKKVNSILDSIFYESDNQQVGKRSNNSDSLLYKSETSNDEIENNTSGETTSQFNNDLISFDRELLHIKSKSKNNVQNDSKSKNLPVNPKLKNTMQKDMRTKVALSYVLNTIELDRNGNSSNSNNPVTTRKTQSDSTVSFSLNPDEENNFSINTINTVSSLNEFKTETSNTTSKKQLPMLKHRGILVKIDSYETYIKQIELLKKSLKTTDEDYRKKIEVMKLQYDNNIKSIMKEHFDGVKNLQNLHEETLQDVIKTHENEVENLRTLSIEAMRKAEKLAKENNLLKAKEYKNLVYMDDVQGVPSESNSQKNNGLHRTLTKTNVEAFNVKPKARTHGPCTCSLDINVSDTIRNIFQQVDTEQRKSVERTYLKHILNKMLSDSVTSLSAQELSFLHLKICRTWKHKLNKEEAFQEKINSLESELINKQKYAQQHIAELDRKVAEERKALQEIREAVFRSNPRSRSASPRMDRGVKTIAPAETATNNCLDCNCTIRPAIAEKHERRAAGDVVAALSNVKSRQRRSRNESNRAVLVNLNVEENRKNLYDERPTRLRKCDDKQKHYHKK